MSWLGWLVGAEAEEENEAAQLGNDRRSIRPRPPGAPVGGQGRAYEHAASPTLTRSLQLATQPGRPQCERVFVRVYDLGNTRLTQWPNAVVKSHGAFHSGVEVYGTEWAFGMTSDYWSTGVSGNLPGHHPDHTFRETLSMGCTTLTQGQVMEILKEMTREWKGRTYDVLNRNCHHFSDELCRRLGVAGLPQWVNRLAGKTASVSEAFEGFTVFGGIYGLFAGSQQAIEDDPNGRASLRDFDSRPARSEYGETRS